MYGKGVYCEGGVEKTQLVNVVDHAKEDGRDKSSVVGQTGEVIVDGYAGWCSTEEVVRSDHHINVLKHTSNETASTGYSPLVYHH